MWRVLRLAGGVMGMALLLTTAGMAWARRDESAWMLVEETSNYREPTRQWVTKEHSRLWLIDSMSGKRVALTQYFDDLSVVAYGQGSGWLYFMAFDTPNQPTSQGGLYRVKLNGLQPQWIIHDPSMKFAQLSPDEGWLAYHHREIVSNSVVHDFLYVAQADGNGLMNLSETSPNESPVEALGPFRFSPDSESIIFTGDDQYVFEGGGTIFQVGLKGLTWDTLISAATQYPAVLDWPPNKEWLVLDRGQNDVFPYLYQDKQTRLLITDMPEDQVRVAAYLGYLPFDDMVLVSLELSSTREIVAARPGGEPLWRVPDGVAYELSPDQEWLYILGFNFIKRIRLDGSDQQTLIQGMDFLLSVTMLVSHKHSEWLIFEDIKSATSDYVVYRMKPDGTEFKKIFETASDEWAYVKSFTPDGKFLIINQYSRSSDSVLLHRMALDGSDKFTLTEGLHLSDFLMWLPPIDRGWTPIYLGIIGAGLIGTYGIRPKKWWDRNH